MPGDASDDVIIALEPGEGLRALHLLKPEGVMVVARSGVAPTVGDFKSSAYSPQKLLDALHAAGAHVVEVDDVALCGQLGSRKALNIIMLASALRAVNAAESESESVLRGVLTLADMRSVIPACVKPRFVDMNLHAIDLVEQS